MNKTETYIAIAISKSLGPVHLIEYLGTVEDDHVSFQLSHTQYVQNLAKDCRPQFPEKLKISLQSEEIKFETKSSDLDLAGRVVEIENSPCLLIPYYDKGIELQVDDIDKFFVINAQQQNIPGHAIIIEYLRDFDIKDIFTFKGIDPLSRHLTNKVERSALVMGEFSEKFRNAGFSNPAEEVKLSFDTEEDCFKLEAQGATNRATAREVKDILMVCTQENIDRVIRKKSLEKTQEHLRFQLSEVEKALAQEE